MFLGLVKNEFIKLFSKKKTYIIIGLYILLSVFIVIIGQNAEDNYFKYNDPDFMIQNLEEQIMYEKEYMESIEIMEIDGQIDEDEKERQIASSMDYISGLEEEIASLEKRKQGEPYDWREDYKNQIGESKIALAELENKEKLTKDDSTQINYIEQDIERLELMLSTDTSPDDENLNTGINYLYNNLLMVTMAFLSFGLILFNSEAVSSEYNPGTLKFLLIQPVTRTKVLLSKFLVMVVSSSILIIGVQILTFLIVSLINGFGALDRPMLIGLEFEKVISSGYESFERIAGSGEFIPLWDYLLRMLVLELFLVITVTAFVFMVSTVAKSSVIANTVCISVLLGSSIVYNLSTKYRQISQLIFLHFGNIDGIVSGSIIGDTGQASFTPITVIMVCVVTTVVVVITALGVFKKRDLLI